MNEFVENYEEMLEEYLEPRDPQKFGRYHTLLDEVIYPLHPNMDYLCQIQYDRMKFEKNRKEGKGVYHWWIPFNEFRLYDPHNMQQWAQPLA